MTLFRNSVPPKMVCHRGGSQNGPENTLAAAKRCFEQGFEVVELDVRTSRDGHLVVIHDATVERVSTSTGAVSEMTLQELGRLDLGRKYGDGWENIGVSPLSEFLGAAKGRGGLMVELKAADPMKVYKEIQSFDGLEYCFFWSSDLTDMRLLRRLDPQISLMARLCDYQNIQDTLADYSPEIVEFDDETDDLSQLQYVRARGVHSMIYAKNGTDQEMAVVCRYCPDFVNTDRPDKFRASGSCSDKTG